METLLQKAEQGDARAMLELAERYYQGNGVEKHLTNALKYWKAAAASDDAEACLIATQRLVQYFVQRGDTFEARKWAEKEMEMGSQEGMAHVAKAMCEQKDMGGLNLLMILVKNGNAYAYGALPHFAQDFIDAGIGITPELRSFIVETYGTNSTSNQTTNESMGVGGKIKLFIGLAFFAVIAIWGLWTWVSATVVVIENGKQHSTRNVMGSTTVVNPDGYEVELRDLQLFTKYVYNGTDVPLVCYNVLYTNDESVGAGFKNSYYTIESNKLRKVQNLPDFYFEEPESIEVEEHWIISIFSSLFGDKEVRWVIDEYITDDNISELSTKALVRLADEGASAIQCELAYRLLNGIDIKADTVKAFQWFQKAAAQGDLMAELSVGMMYSYGWGTPENPQKAFEYIYKVAKADIAEAQWYLALFYHNGYGTKRDIRKSEEYMEKSAKGGYPVGQAEWALHLLDKGYPEEAIGWLEKALKQEVNPAYISAAGFKLANMSDRKRIEQGYKYLKYAAEHGDADATSALEQFPTLDSLIRYRLG